ncbi:MAG: hypothetical protein ACFFAN_04940 [Promethearchaeota archaeon]
MIRDVIIIKDGLPLFKHSFIRSCRSEKAINSNLSNSPNIFGNLSSNNLIMISGFFSALNSFSDQFQDLGSINEIKLVKSDFKLSFLKDSIIPNLIYIATFDERSKSVDVQRVLRRISNTFLKRYNINQIANWRGRVNIFKEFEETVVKYIEHEEKESDLQFKEKVMELFHIIKEKILEDNDNLKRSNNQEIRIEKDQKGNFPEYYNYIPILKLEKKINPEYYLTGKLSHKIFNQINGKISLHQIAKNLNVNPYRVYAICKNLVKLGFISLF